jgi:hypothetical protein
MNEKRLLYILFVSEFRGTAANRQTSAQDLPNFLRRE